MQDAGHRPGMLAGSKGPPGGLHAPEVASAVTDAEGCWSCASFLRAASSSGGSSCSCMTSAWLSMQQASDLQAAVSRQQHHCGDCQAGARTSRKSRPATRCRPAHQKRGLCRQEAGPDSLASAQHSLSQSSDTLRHMQATVTWAVMLSHCSTAQHRASCLQAPCGSWPCAAPAAPRTPAAPAAAAHLPGRCASLSPRPGPLLPCTARHIARPSSTTEAAQMLGDGGQQQSSRLTLDQQLRSVGAPGLSAAPLVVEDGPVVEVGERGDGGNHHLAVVPDRSHQGVALQVQAAQVRQLLEDV